MRFQLIGSIDAIPVMLGPEELENWGSNNYYTYIRLPADYDYKALEAQFPAFLDRHRGEGDSEGAEEDHGQEGAR